MRVVHAGPVVLVDGMPRTALDTITGGALLWDGEARAWRVAARRLPALRDWCASHGRDVVEEDGR